MEIKFSLKQMEIMLRVLNETRNSKIFYYLKTEDRESIREEIERFTILIEQNKIEEE